MSLKDKEAQRKYQREYMKKWREENPGKERVKTYQERLQYNREYNRRNHEKLSKRKREYYQEHKEYFKQKADDWYKRNKGKVAEKARILREKVITHYGGKCVCCGETEIKFLAVDHKNNDGAVHRREIGTNIIYKWAVDNHYPDKLQILCHNCNLAKAFYGKCPHNKEKNTG